MPGETDELVNDGYALAVGQPFPVAVDEFGLSRADKVVAVVVVDKEEAVLAIDHRGQNLGDPGLGLFVVGRGGAVDMGKPVAGLGDIVAQLGLLGTQELPFQRLDLAFRQGLRLIGNQCGNRGNRHDKR